MTSAPTPLLQPKLCDACETVSHCTAHGCIPVREATPSPTAGMNMAQRILHVGGRNPPGSTYVEFGSIQAVEALVKQVLRDRKPAPESVLHHALAVAVDHIDIEALRVSHCKDASTIEAALHSSVEPAESVLVDGVSYLTPAPVAAKLLQLHLELQARAIPKSSATLEQMKEWEQNGELAERMWGACMELEKENAQLRTQLSAAQSAATPAVVQTRVQEWCDGARFALQAVSKVSSICWLTDSMRDVAIKNAVDAVIAERDRRLTSGQEEQHHG